MGLVLFSTMNQIEKRIHNILNNTQGEVIRNRKVGERREMAAKLLGEQLKTLGKFADYYGLKPSSRGGKIKSRSVVNCLAALRSLGLYIKKPYEKATQQDLINFIKWLADNTAPRTVSNWKVSIRTFYKWMHGVTKPHEFPKIVDHELLKPERVITTMKPNDLLTRDEVMEMVNACFEPRSKSIIMCLYEGGLRAGELISANVDSVAFDQYGCKFLVEESKTKQRQVRLVEAAPFLKQWVNIHPDKSNPKAPLFCGLSAYAGKRLLPQGINWVVLRVAKRAGIKKHVHAHLLRHCAVTNLQRQGFDIVLNAKRHGITTDTLQKVYLHYDDRDVDNAFIKLNGGKSDVDLATEREENEKLAPKKCVACGQINPFEAQYCEHCKRPVDLRIFLEMETKREHLDVITERAIEMQVPLSKELVKEVLKEMIKSGEIKI